MKYTDLNERRIHGTEEFPIEYYRVDPTHPRYVMEAHWHTEAEIIRVVEGRFSLSLNRNQYTLSAGDVAFVNAGVLHHGEGEHCTYECVVFKPEKLLRGGIADAYIKPLSRRLCTVCEYLPQAAHPQIALCADKLLLHLSKKADFYELATVAALGELFYLLYQCNLVNKQTLPRAQEKQIEQLTLLLTWMEDHYAERITLGDLSRESGMNEKYLCRFFKAYTSHTPIDYVNRLRIEHASDDLRTKHVSVTDAAYANGFNDSAYFSKLFRKIKGVTPIEYRKGIS